MVMAIGQTNKIVFLIYLLLAYGSTWLFSTHQRRFQSALLHLKYKHISWV